MARSTARLLEHSPLSLGPMARHGSSSEVFSEHFLERRDIEHLLRQHLLQLRILGLQRLQPPGVGHFHAAILRPPLVEGRIANPVLAAQILCAHSRRRPNDRLQALSVVTPDCRHRGPWGRQAIEGVRKTERISSSACFASLMSGPKSSSEIRSVISAFRTSEPPRFQRPRSNGQLFPDIMDTKKLKMDIYC